jgi:hypothetical protein
MQNAHDLSLRRVDMSGEVREGERIPRRDPPPYEEADSFSQAISRDGLFATAINDSNLFDGLKGFDENLGLQTIQTAIY